MQIVELQIEDNYIENVMAVLKNLKDGMIQNITVKNDMNDNKNNKIDFDDFAGMWKDRDIDIESIRKNAWKK